MNGWTEVALGEVVAFRSGGTPSRDNPEYFGGAVPWITGADIGGGGVTAARTTLTEAGLARSSAPLVAAGTVLLVTRTSVGKAALAPYDLSFSQDITGLVPDDDRVDRHYLRHYLESRRGYFERRSRGATIKGITREVVSNLGIPLPPLDEQCRIARILDAAEALRAMRSRGLDLRTELTRSMRARAVDRSVRSVELGEIAHVRGGKRLPKGQPYSDVPTEHRYIRVTDFVDGTISASSLPFLDAVTQAKIRRYTVAVGDVLISIAGSIGRVCTVPGAVSGANLTENAARLTPRSSDLYDPVYLEHVLRAPDAQRQIRRLTGQVTIGKLALHRIERIRLPLPPLAEQRAFAAFARAAEAVANASTRHQSEATALFAALQERAFAGRL